MYSEARLLLSGTLYPTLYTLQPHISAHDETPPRELVQPQVYENGKQRENLIKGTETALNMSIGTANHVFDRNVDWQVLRRIMG